VVGLTRGVRCRPVLKYAHRRDLDRLAEAVTKGLRVWIDCEFPLDGAAAAHRRQEEGPSGKVIVRVRPDPGAP
jgi:NADPH:quinone reductase-like Zn-dependent oxidoreductase